MVYLAKTFSKKKVSPLKIISQKEGIPFDFLEKIFSELEKEGLVKAKKGFGGGYFLARNPKNITARDIVSVLEGSMMPVYCIGCVRARSCISKNVWDEVQVSLDSALNSITLEDLIHPVK